MPCELLRRHLGVPFRDRSPSISRRSRSMFITYCFLPSDGYCIIHNLFDIITIMRWSPAEYTIGTSIPQNSLMRPFKKIKNCQTGHGVVYLPQDIGGTKLFRRKDPAPIRHLLLGSKLRLTVQRGTEVTGARLVTPTRTTARECWQRPA